MVAHPHRSEAWRAVLVVLLPAPHTRGYSSSSSNTMALWVEGAAVPTGGGVASSMLLSLSHCGNVWRRCW